MWRARQVDLGSADPPAEHGAEDPVRGYHTEWPAGPVVFGGRHDAKRRNPPEVAHGPDTGCVQRTMHYWADRQAQAAMKDPKQRTAADAKREVPHHRQYVLLLLLDIGSVPGAEDGSGYQLRWVFTH
jgi:hypothetical protein